MVSLSDVRFGRTNNDVMALQGALIEAAFSAPAGATSLFGPQGNSACASRQPAIGFNGSDADGFPDCTLLTELGVEAGFNVDFRDSGAIAKSSVQCTRNSRNSTDKGTTRTFTPEVCATGAPREWDTGVNNDANLLTLMQRESASISNAVNQNDMNATGSRQVGGARLNCSRGYAQVIPDTFAWNHQIGATNQIHYPVADIAAAISCIWRRSGDISRAQQVNPHLPSRPY